MPHEQVPIVGVELVQVGGTASALSGGAEGPLTQATDLLQRQGRLIRGDVVHVPIAARQQPGPTRKRRHLCGQRLRGHGCGDRLETASPRTAAQQRSSLGRIGYQAVGAHTQIRRLRRRAADCGESPLRDDAAEAEAYSPATLAEQFAAEHRRSEPWADPPSSDEPLAVLSVHEYRQHRRVGVRRQARRAVSPYRIDDAPVGGTNVRHFAGRKHHQHVASAQPLEGAAHAASVAGAARREAVDGHHILAHLGNSCQQVIAKQLHVGADPAEQCRQRQSIERSVRVIRHHEQRSSRWHPVPLRRVAGVDSNLE